MARLYPPIIWAGIQTEWFTFVTSILVVWTTVLTLFMLFHLRLLFRVIRWSIFTWLILFGIGLSDVLRHRFIYYGLDVLHWDIRAAWFIWLSIVIMSVIDWRFLIPAIIVPFFYLDSYDLQLVLKYVIGLSDIAKQRKSREDDARVRNTIDLLNSILEYEKLLRVIEDPNDNSIVAEIKDRLPFEYSHSHNRFEIRMITPMQAGIRGLIGGLIGIWQRNLEESNDERISNISKTILSLCSERLKFSDGPGAKDMKAPDWGIRHTCKHTNKPEYQYPNLIFEIFRDLQGNAIRSKSPVTPFDDFMCMDIMSAQRGKLKAPSLEISSKDLCDTIEDTLEMYRMQKTLEIREEVAREERVKIGKRKKDEERL
ncbi:hypothetical protein GQX73_g1833 [Xylaria multiplex]|uniref:Uncharacterized protein n=1 Tax=Xylaria multiplex TaxID=323545 RepID=A0A7C8ITB5_9PEZI|nr:hypothetical protein GQX73_g1833 [Xylaria multiplex]